MVIHEVIFYMVKKSLWYSEIYSQSFCIFFRVSNAIFVWNYFKYDKGHIKIWIRIKKIKENFNLISEYRRCFQISFKKKKILAYLSEFTRIFARQKSHIQL